MTAALSGHALPWSEEDYLALGETPERIELFDGSLYVSAAPTPRHQIISSRLLLAFLPGATAAGLHVLEAVNVRLKPGRIPIPDLVLAGDIDVDDPVVPATAVKLVCEIISPHNASADEVLKMHFYAVAGIPWYLLVEQATGALHLHRINGSHYVEHSVTKPGGTLHLTEPVEATVRPDDLVP